MCFYFFNACLNSFADFKKENKLQRRSDETFKKPQIWDDRIEIEYTKENIINVRIRSSKRKKRCQELPLRDYIQRHYNHQHGSCKYASVCLSNKVKKLDTLVVQSYIILHFFGSYQLQWQ